MTQESIDIKESLSAVVIRHPAGQRRTTVAALAPTTEAAHTALTGALGAVHQAATPEEGQP